MTGDCHVRICGSPGVRFPRATRPHLVPSIAEMSYPSTIIKYMFDIRQLDDSSGTITPAPGPAPGSGRQAISTTGPAADPGPPGAALPLERLEAQICELAGHLAAATCRFLVLLGDFDARRGWASWDMNSCAQWLSWKCQMSSGAAREHVRVARALRDLPVLRAGPAGLARRRPAVLRQGAGADPERDPGDRAGPG